MSNNKPNGIHHGYQYENGKSKRSAIQTEWYGLLLHAKDSSSKRDRVEDLEFRKRSRSAVWSDVRFMKTYRDRKL
jgi:hypothetical protein